MVIRNVHDLTYGRHVATFMVQINHQGVLVFKHADFKVCTTIMDCNTWLDKELKELIKDKLEHYCNQREHAVILDKDTTNALFKIRNAITKAKTLNDYCQLMIDQWPSIELLQPSSTSRFSSWATTMKLLLKVSEGILKPQHDGKLHYAN